jgi:hypothetical protein
MKQACEDRDGEVCVAQAASPSLAQDLQQLEAHVLTSVAAEGLARNMQREDQLIFALLHTFWEVRPVGLPLILPVLYLHLLPQPIPQYEW